MNRNILIVGEQRDGKLKRVSLEAIGIATRISKLFSGKTPETILIGSNIEGLVGELCRYGSGKVYLAESDSLKLYSSDAYATVISDYAKANGTNIIILGASAMGKDLGPKIAAKMETSFASDCVGIEIDNQGILVATRPIYGGKIWSKVISNNQEKQVISIRPNIFSPLDPDDSRPVLFERINTNLGQESFRARVKEIIATAGSSIDLTEASIIVSGGRGLKSPENFKYVEDLAKVLGAAVGASRAAVDAGWKPHSFQVGLTGRTVSPNLYIACGISGAIQHQAGMSSSKFIVAINKDPEAPIFKIANYGIVGDLFEILPLLTEEVKKIKGE